jgi:hypothetical protein
MRSPGRLKAPIWRFSKTLMRLKTLRPSGECAIPSFTISCAGMAWISRPASLMDPERGLCVPLMARSVVLLPAPFEPMSVTTSPRPTVSDTPLSASMLP